jgi:hypothetical protein
MKRLATLCALLAAVCLAAPAAHAQTLTAGTATKIVVSWNALVYPAGTPNCSATVAVDCAQGYTLTIQGPAPTPVTIPPCTATVTANCIHATDTSFTWAPGGGLYYGSYQISLVGNAVGDTTATPLVSPTPATATAVYALSLKAAPSPGGLTVQFQ